MFGKFIIGVFLFPLLLALSTAKIIVITNVSKSLNLVLKVKWYAIYKKYNEKK